MRKLISSGSPYEDQAAFSRAVTDGDWCWVAGTTGYDWETRIMPEDVAEQARNALRTIGRVMAEAGFSLADTVRAIYYVSEQSYWHDIAPVLKEAFDDVRPAATCIVCGFIAPEMKVEIAVTAKRRAS